MLLSVLEACNDDAGELLGATFAGWKWWQFVMLCCCVMLIFGTVSEMRGRASAVRTRWRMDPDEEKQWRLEAEQATMQRRAEFREDIASGVAAGMRLYGGSA